MADQPASIFGSTPNTDTNPNPTGSNPAPAVNNDLATLLGSIKNERGEQKYRDINDAMTALQHSQEFIPTLKSQYEAEKAEAQRLREEVARLKTVEETVAALTLNRQEQQGTPPVAFDEKQIADLVNRTLTQRSEQATASSNLESVVASLQTAFGADAETKFYDKAKELGMTVAEMNTLAAKSPKAVLSMLGVNGQATPQRQPTVTTSSVNTSAFQPNQETFVGRNSKTTLIGATTQDLQFESHNARKMVEELHAQGKSVHDLTDPKVYFKLFGKTN